ncbi:MAG: hypothetical protein FAZ92_03390 [Accumulibacter sp.]|nr:MAG: hypothetical protein FAZ92_03390 [Accumulibacter sp.]
MAKLVGDRLGALVQPLAREDLARPDLHQLPELLFGQRQVAGQLHRGDEITLPFVDADRDVDLFLVGRDRHLRRLDAEFEIAAIQVVRAQRLEVRRQLLPRVLVVLGVPADPATRLLLHDGQQVLLANGIGADDVDLPDARRLTLVDGEVDRHPVALEWCDGRRDRHRVPAARQILPLQLLLGLLQRCPVEGPRDGDAHFLQSLDQLVLVELLQADKIDLRDRRALLDDDDHHPAIHLDADILEEAGGKQRLDRLRSLLVGHRLADLDRQIAEDRAGLDALNSLDADVAHGERLDRHRCGGKERGQQTCEQVFLHKLSRRTSG